MRYILLAALGISAPIMDVVLDKQQPPPKPIYAVRQDVGIVYRAEP